MQKGNLGDVVKKKREKYFLKTTKLWNFFVPNTQKKTLLKPHQKHKCVVVEQQINTIKQLFEMNCSP